MTEGIPPMYNILVLLHVLSHLMTANANSNTFLSTKSSPLQLVSQLLVLKIGKIAEGINQISGFILAHLAFI